ncbi:Arabinanase/levansucrase/invertase [Aureobasidium subglaciale]|uniref:Glycoside hydrolase family 43 protein n=1 Tax=Aureobasidium subglaciale (strain EXF-2481) TaxID=1043005 RepID=A0A074YHI7_AURSE|nr:glycoside hydrolase family 43 protein [Aureobasidium subglaciale EXF-2481]KAI5205952.1 Arabinanase/levansucrase/invertase [Aureobasidium subglaciale]KAI5224825.1 Arabinanase/levansucrase/invertase [Aureobasidium subglaciale]KAI5227937.1 Arabinanase/levansucrase/invertase [Aureobasidium subglaciale]KAI5255762.1 Arabinanase/levansucrase/invertase [Aureobasidium subglaciale]KAI5263490.1 Arabinanase/levansucrase/invertase [Aureobasidium subglaciale]
MATEGSLISPSFAEFRKRSLPSHIIESQKKEALAMVSEKESEDEQPRQVQPSLIKRYFYKKASISGTGDSGSDEETILRFSFLSRGFITLAVLLCMIIVATLCAVLATIYVRHHDKEEALRRSPVHEAVFANFADPAVIEHEGLFYAFATTNAAGILAQPHNTTVVDYGRSNVQIATSPDFKNWTQLDYKHDPLPSMGNWVKSGLTEKQVPKANVWAPAVIRRATDNKFILYYSAAAENATRSHCIGAAISETSSPAGPYSPLNTTIACPISKGGAIDPSPFIDTDGSFYVVYKVDGNNVGNGGICGNSVPPLASTPIKLQRMNADGVTPEGLDVTILDRIEQDGPLVEAPVLVKSAEGIYFLFFSSGCTRDPSYDVKYAWSKNIEGPYRRASKPLLKTDDFDLNAPGSIGLTDLGDGTFGMVFHARVETLYGRVRAMYTSIIRFHGTKVVIDRKNVVS